MTDPLIVCSTQFTNSTSLGDIHENKLTNFIPLQCHIGNSKSNLGN